MTDLSNATTRLRVSARFIIRGVWMKPEALGQVYIWTSGNYTVKLTLPNSSDEFAAIDEAEIPVISSWVPTARMEGSGSAVAVQIIKLEVDFEGSPSAAWKEMAQSKAENGNDEEIRKFQSLTERLWQEAFNAAEHSAHAWLNHIRTIAGQEWLGIASEKPHQYGRSHIFDLDSDSRLMSFGPIKSLTIRSGQLALSVEQLKQIHEKILAQEEPPTPDSLLADSRFLVHGAEVVDPQRAVLIAAMASEIKTKSTIIQRTNPVNHDLVLVVLRRMSNVPDLLTQLLPSVTGRSIKDDDPELLKDIRELNTQRNSIVHSGVQVDANKGWQLVVSARRLFEWLDSL